MYWLYKEMHLRWNFQQFSIGNAIVHKKYRYRIVQFKMFPSLDLSHKSHGSFNLATRFVYFLVMYYYKVVKVQNAILFIGFYAFTAEFQSTQRIKPREISIITFLGDINSTNSLSANYWKLTYLKQSLRVI